jgi:hypothetical protein
LSSHAISIQNRSYFQQALSTKELAIGAYHVGRIARKQDTEKPANGDY